MGRKPPACIYMLSGFWILWRHYLSKYLKTQCNKMKIILTKKTHPITQLPAYYGLCLLGTRRPGEPPSYLGKLPNGSSVGRRAPPPTGRAWASASWGLSRRRLKCSLTLNLEGMTNEQLQVILFTVAAVSSWVQCWGQKCPGHKNYFNFCIFLVRLSPASLHRHIFLFLISVYKVIRAIDNCISNRSIFYV